MVGWIDDGIVLTLLTTELSRLVIDYRQRRQNLIEVDSPSVDSVSQ
ncbi:MAG: hypothetical protein GVY04_13785 [Cyanobacteria bacterium]|nr:hypothetical protein [Cyanobacteria bacterium GSL.Bin1]